MPTAEIEMEVQGLSPAPSHWLSVDTTPITGVDFTVDGIAQITPYSASLTQGSYVVTLPKTVVIAGKTYVFKQWEDGLTNPSRTVSLVVDAYITATFESDIATVLDISALPLTGQAPLKATVSGYLRRTSDGRGIADQAIELIIDDVRVGATMTQITPLGYYTKQCTLPTAKTYALKTEFVAEGYAIAYSPTIEVVVEEGVPLPYIEPWKIVVIVLSGIGGVGAGLVINRARRKKK